MGGNRARGIHGTGPAVVTRSFDRVRRFVVPAAVLAATACGCASASPAGGRGGVRTATTTIMTTTVPTSTSSTTTWPLPLQTYQLGETASLSVQDPENPHPTANVDIRVNGIDDPSDMVGLDIGNSYENYPQPPPAGKRNVDVNVTIKNTGHVVLPAQLEGDPGVLTGSWGLNSTSALYEGTYFQGGLPNQNCHGSVRPDTADLDEGQSMTGCVLFLDIPNDVPITAVVGWIEFAGHAEIPTRWLVKKVR